MEEKKLLQIGEFSKLAGISISYLRRLHKSGVFVPDMIAQRGYRYYAADRVAELEAIRAEKRAQARTNLYEASAKASPKAAQNVAEEPQAAQESTHNTSEGPAREPHAQTKSFVGSLNEKTATEAFESEADRLFKELMRETRKQNAARAQSKVRQGQFGPDVCIAFYTKREEVNAFRRTIRFTQRRFLGILSLIPDKFTGTSISASYGTQRVNAELYQTASDVITVPYTMHECDLTKRGDGINEKGLAIWRDTEDFFISLDDETSEPVDETCAETNELRPDEQKTDEQKPEGQAQEEEKPGITVGYARVFSASQKNKKVLDEEIVRLTKYLESQGEPFEIITDIGTNQTFGRPGIMRLLQSVLEDRVSKIVVSYRDTIFVRGFTQGYEFFEMVCDAHGCAIEILSEHKSIQA